MCLCARECGCASVYACKIVYVCSCVYYWKRRLHVSLCGSKKENVCVYMEKDYMCMYVYKAKSVYVKSAYTYFSVCVFEQIIAICSCLGKVSLCEYVVKRVNLQAFV